MHKFKILYCPIGVGTFHLESANRIFADTAALIKSFEPEVIVPEGLLLSLDVLKAFISDKAPDLVIIQNATFANAAQSTEIFKTFNADYLLWTVREPVIDGGRLRLNSLTGAFSAGNAFYNMKDGNIQYIFGSPGETEVKEKLKKILVAARIKHEMKGMNLLMVGHTPEGFGFGRALDLEMAKNFGVNLQTVESRELTNLAKNLKEEEFAKAEKSAKENMIGIEKTQKKNRVDFYKLLTVYKEYIQKHNIKAIASRCWPDFFVEYGTPVCAVLGMLNNEKIAAACEADAYGALSMYIGQCLTDQSTYLGDPVSLDESENTITFWHCGTGACSLARKDTGALTGVHPNRQIGPTMEFGLKPSEKATAFRIGRKNDGTFRFFILEGEILDKPKQFFGTSAVMKIGPEVKPLVKRLIKEGWEPHFVLLYDNVAEELEILAELLNIEVCKY